MKRNAFRDFFRKRRVAEHYARHGDMFDFHGARVRLPRDVDVAAANALIRGKYEREEAALILKHLPTDLPVVELGGSLGVVSALIRSRLAPQVRHLIVEANPGLIPTLTENAKRGAMPGATEIVHAALAYDTESVQFAIADEVHSSSIAGVGAKGRVIDVTAVTLAGLYRQIGSPERFVLVSDVEGAEYQLFERETDVLSRITLAIVELHPRDYRKHGLSETVLHGFFAHAGLSLVERLADVVVLKRT